jgi:phenylalanyl-tRNA synthetase beta chain
MANSLTSPDYCELLGYGFKESAVTMLNPLGTELSVMRQSLLFSGLEAISYNINRKNRDLKFFEFGKTYRQTDKNRIENKHLSLFLTGNRTGDSWALPEKRTDFFYLKSIVTNVLSRLGISETVPRPTQNTIFSEGFALTFNSKELVSLGTVKKSILKEMDIKQEILYADFNWDQVIALAKKNDINYREIPKYPEAKRDFALLLDDRITFQQVYELGRRTEKKWLKQINLFDVYTGKNLPDGKKSYAVSFTLQNPQHTLTDKQIDKIMDKLQRSYEEELGAELR